MNTTDAMVNRFLGWRLPDGFCPDCYIKFDKDAAKRNNGWPIGTNLFSADQAREMLEYVLGGSSPARVPSESERAAFEASLAWRSPGCDLSRHPRTNAYNNRYTEHDWLGWQARALLAGSSGGSDSPTPKVIIYAECMANIAEELLAACVAVDEARVIEGSTPGGADDLLDNAQEDYANAMLNMRIRISDFRAALSASTAPAPMPELVGKLGDGAKIRCRKCGEMADIEFNVATYPAAPKGSASEAATEPKCERLLIDWEMEPEPIAGHDAIYAVYATTMGKPAPDAEMAHAMRKVSAMLTDWWAWNRDTIRAALVAYEAAQSVQGQSVGAVPEATKGEQP